ncbi:MAG: acetyltransferase [Solirubrobacterales bacterium]|nr:acetyltransferase [Solirubrobacterales bacterium]
MSVLERLHASLLELAAVDTEHLRIGPFAAYVHHERTPNYYSFAIPDPHAEPAALTAALAPLRAAYAERNRNARVEILEALNPELEAILLAEGWTLSVRMPVMVCPPAGYVAPPAAERVTVELVGPDSPDELVWGFLRAQRVAFRDETEITDEEVARWRARSATAFSAAGLLDGAIVGTALCTPIVAGTTEVGGVATPPEFRRRGIAAAVTAAALEAAFAAGAELAWLSAASDDSHRIYDRMGFEVAGTLLAYDAPT